MRTGSDYRAALRDGRKVWIVGEGLIDDVTTHPATRRVVDEYVAWYDMHHDTAWRAVVLAPDGVPWGRCTPRSPDDLVAMGKCFNATLFASAGNITHTPNYGYLIALGILYAAQQRNVSGEQIAYASRYREMLMATGRFLTFSSGTAVIGYRMRQDPSERAALRIIRETDAGLVISGKIAMLTSPAFAEDVYIGSISNVPYGEHFATFLVGVNWPGVRVICRRISPRHPNPFLAPMSNRFDELDGQMFLDNVLVPWERVMLLDAFPEAMASWLFWHQLYCWLAKFEFTLGLALACAHATGLTQHEQTIEYIVDLITEVQTVRSCLTAAERDPEVTPQGYCIPGRRHIAAGTIAVQKARQRVTEILRTVPGSSLVVAPSNAEFADSTLASDLEEAFGGGGYSGIQRSALLSLAWDHVASALDGRESAFELHANGGLHAWRSRLRRDFDRYNELANGVLRDLGVEMPHVDVNNIRERPMTPRRPIMPS